MQTFTINESCGCGASTSVTDWVASTAQRHLQAFRDAHASCRRSSEAEHAGAHDVSGVSVGQDSVAVEEQT